MSEKHAHHEQQASGEKQPWTGEERRQSGGGEILHAIAELETQLSTLKQRQQEAHNLELALQQQQAELKANEDKLGQREQALQSGQQQLNVQQEEIKAAKAQLEQQTREAQQRLQQAQEQIAAIQSREQQLATAKQHLSEQQAAFERQCQQVREQIQQERESLDQREATLKSRESDETAQQEHDRTKRALQDAHEHIKQLEHELAESRTKLSDAVKKLESLHAKAQQEIAKRDAAIQEISCQLEEAQQSNANTQGVFADHVARRHERLRRYKQLVSSHAKEQWKKINAAKESVQRKSAECDKILHQRSKLASAIVEVNKLEKKFAAKKATTSATAAMLCFAATLAVLAGLSWAVVKQVSPGTYIARAVIEADARALTPDEQRIADWQLFHEELVTDPRLMAEAADRMGRRGITTLSDPAELNAVMNDQLFIESARDGVITVEYRDTGAQRAELVLDTFVTAMVSMANTGRGSRSDGIAAAITQPAIAASRPIGNEHFIYAAGSLGGSMTAAILLGLVVWSRAQRSKQNFEKNIALEEALASMHTPGDDENRYQVS